MGRHRAEGGATVKRILAFLLLLAVGIFALRIAIGDDDIVTASGPVTTETTEPLNHSDGVPIQQGQIGATWQTRGRFHYPKVRTIPQPDGSERNEPVFDLDAKDSQPVRDGLQQLDEVVVTLFDRGVPAATLTSKQAFVELGRDLSGKPSVREDKEIDLREAVFETLPGSRAAGLRLELERALVLVREEYIQLRTPNETDPVLLVLDGKSSGSLRGKGLQARIPRDRRGAMQRADIDVLHEPVLEANGLAVRARGRMHYAEDMTSGAALITVEDDVFADFTRAGGLQLRGIESFGANPSAAVQGKATVHGDQLTGWLQRSQVRNESGGNQSDLGWQLVQLRGGPATVDAPGMHLATPNLTLQPGMSGEPFVITASGGQSRLEQVLSPEQVAKGEVALVGESPRRIHMLRPGMQAGALLGAYGFPQWTLRQLQEQQAVVFEGRAKVTGGERLLQASRGLQVFRPGSAGDAAVVHGFGDVHIEQRAVRKGQKDLVANGSDGFVMTLLPSSETLDLGPPRTEATETNGAWHNHHYDLQYGTANIDGVGTCHVERHGSVTELQLRAPNSEIRGHLSDVAGELAEVRSLRAQIDGEVVKTFVMTGIPAIASFARGLDRLTATSPCIEQLGPASLSLLPPTATEDATLWRGLAKEQALPKLQRISPATATQGAEDVATTAARIDVYYLGREDVIVDAHADGDVPARATGRLERLGHDTPTTMSLDAQRLRLFPYALPPQVLSAHAGGAAGPLAELPAFALGQAWIIADRVHELTVDDSEQGHVEGNGQLLLLSRGAEAGLFVGDPESMTPTVVTRVHEGRSITATGARVRMFRDTELRLQALRTFPGHSIFLLPTVVLHQPGTNTALAHMSATCRGDIDVLPAAVVFLGPVVANSVMPDDSIDPDGMHIEANQLRMDRKPKSGEIIKILGRQVNLLWHNLKAQSAEVEMDLREGRHQLIARDPEGARIDFLDGRRIVAERLEVNYDTMAVDAYRVMIDREVKATGDQR
jgi:hypothetical protein